MRFLVIFLNNTRAQDILFTSTPFLYNKNHFKNILTPLNLRFLFAMDCLTFNTNCLFQQLRNFVLSSNGLMITAHSQVVDCIQDLRVGLGDFVFSSVVQFWNSITSLDFSPLVILQALLKTILCQLLVRFCNSLKLLLDQFMYVVFQTYFIFPQSHRH